MLVCLGLQSLWLVAAAPPLLLGLAVLGALRRRAELRASALSRRERAEAKERGSHRARLQHPDIDLSKCIGCGSCVRACPEDGVLSLLHGQAMVVHGARCVGHGLCAAACPTGAIALTLGDLSERRDLPALADDLEAVGTPGLYLAGELSGFALVRTAISQGVAVAEAVARRASVSRPVSRPAAVTVGAGPGEDFGEPDEIVNLLIAGAGPAGLACALRAKELGIRFEVIEQEPRVGGTVAAYPRRKLVMTQPMELPLYGRLPRLSYQKEELVAVWERAASANDLPIRTGVRLIDLARDDEGIFVAKTSAGDIRARGVCLALGRRGSPRKLGIPGEDLPKVAFSLLDAESYQGRRILVVGGGDSAIEAALGLAEQPGNEVTISYRKSAFFRLKARNETRIQKAIQQEHVRVLFDSEPTAIEPDRVLVRVGAEASAHTEEIANDEVFIFAGGDPPFALLERAGVSFDPKDRPPPPTADRGSGLLSALSLALVLAVGALVWAVWHNAYYGMEGVVRAASPHHGLLRPGGGVGLALGVLACALMVWNLLYLVRRSARIGGWLPGSLKVWMGSHVFTGLASLLCVLVHAGFAARPTVGGHALLALVVVVATGSVGRYLYAFVPHAANGAELDLDDLRSQLAAMSADWDRDGRGFGEPVRDQIDNLITTGRWRPGLLARIGALVAGQVRLRRSLRRLAIEGARSGIPAREIRRVELLARRAYRLTLQVTHYEEIRGVLASWRYFHRWLALLMILLAAAHIVTAVRYAHLDWGGWSGEAAP